MEFNRFKSILSEKDPNELKEILSRNPNLINDILSSEKSEEFTNFACQALAKVPDIGSSKIFTVLRKNITLDAPSKMEFLTRLVETVAAAKIGHHAEKEGPDFAIRYLGSNHSMLGTELVDKLAARFLSEEDQERLSVYLEFKDFFSQTEELDAPYYLSLLLGYSSILGEALTLSLADRYFSAKVSFELIKEFENRAHMAETAHMFRRRI